MNTVIVCLATLFGVSLSGHFGNYNLQENLFYGKYSNQEEQECLRCVKRQGFYSYSLYSINLTPLKSFAISEFYHICIEQWMNRTDFLLLVGHFTTSQCKASGNATKVVRIDNEIINPDQIWYEEYLWKILYRLNYVINSYGVYLHEERWFPKELREKRQHWYYELNERDMLTMVDAAIPRRQAHRDGKEKNTSRSTELTLNMQPIIVETTTVEVSNAIEVESTTEYVRSESSLTKDEIEFNNLYKRLLPGFLNISEEWQRFDLIDYIMHNKTFENCSSCEFFYPKGNGVGCQLYKNYTTMDIKSYEMRLYFPCCIMFLFTDENIDCIITNYRPLSKRTVELKYAFGNEANRTGNHKVGEVTIPCSVSGCEDNTYERFRKEGKSTPPPFRNVVATIFQKQNVSINRLAEEAKEIVENELGSRESETYDYEYESD